MGTKVTIEGSRITPTDKLPAGVRTTVELTPETQEFINRGYAVEISRVEIPDEAPVETSGEGQTPAPDSGAEGDKAQDADADVVPAPEAADGDTGEGSDSGEGSETASDPDPAEKPSRSRRGAKTADTPEE